MGEGGHISVYLDCNSPWSYFAYTKLRQIRSALLQHGITIEMHPIFLGGINVGSGNKPPWTLPAKAKLGKYELPRGMKYFGTETLTAPSFFPIMSLLPMRCMLYAKENYPYEQYENAFGELWRYLWIEHKDVSKPEVLAECLGKYFGKEDVEKIVKSGTDPKYKKMLTDETAMLVEKGAFGAPWFLVTHKNGVEEPFFGSDREVEMVLDHCDTVLTNITDSISFINSWDYHLKTSRFFHRAQGRSCSTH